MPNVNIPHQKETSHDILVVVVTELVTLNTVTTESSVTSVDTSSCPNQNITVGITVTELNYLHIHRYVWYSSI